MGIDVCRGNILRGVQPSHFGNQSEDHAYRRCNYTALLAAQPVSGAARAFVLPAHTLSRLYNGEMHRHPTLSVRFLDADSDFLACIDGIGKRLLAAPAVV